jgi:hypothetical protein
MAALDELIKLKNKLDASIQDHGDRSITINQNNMGHEISNKLGEVIGKATKIISKGVSNTIDTSTKFYTNKPGEKKATSLPAAVGNVILPSAEATQPSDMNPYNANAYTNFLASQNNAAIAAAQPAPTPPVASVPSPASGQTLANAVPKVAPGIFAGAKEGILGMPQSNVGQFPGQGGRTTAYYAGKALGDLVRNKMGLTTAGEEMKLAAATPGTPQYQRMSAAAVAAKTAARQAQFPLQLTPEDAANLKADLAKYGSLATTSEDKKKLATMLGRKYPGASETINRIFGVNAALSEQEKLSLMMQSIEESQNQ